MHERTIGDTPVSAIGLGTMVFGFSPAASDAASVATMHSAFDAGISFVDTALAYTSDEEPRHGERVVAEAVRSSGRPIHIATKGGHWRAEGEGWDFPKDGRPETIRENCDGSLRALGVDAIWLYQLHWPDPEVPIEETMGAFAELQTEGKVRHVGVSNFSVEQLERARSVVDVAAVQNRFSIVVQDDRAVVDYCAKEGIAYLAYSPVGGWESAKQLTEVVPETQRIAEDRGITAHQVALAWLLAQSPTMIPIPGSSRVESAVASATAADVELSEEELARLT
jgi:aryl-alcohol dehydrogenase-like predicted oxidoreductase